MSGKPNILVQFVEGVIVRILTEFAGSPLETGKRENCRTLEILRRATSIHSISPNSCSGFITCLWPCVIS